MGEVRTYRPTAACKKCGGRCCQRMGCHFSPTDFEEITVEALKKEIEKGYISIDWWETMSKPQYYLRTRHVNAPVVDPSWGGRCVLLTDKGCSLSFEKRPLGGRALKPGRIFCDTDYTKEDCKNEWLAYRDVLEELVRQYKRKE